MNRYEEFIWVPHDEVPAREAEGWRICDGWKNAEHHLRYSVPMWRATITEARDDDVSRR